MKLSISNIAWEEKNDSVVYGYMKQYGFKGVEIAPTRWVPEAPYDKIEDAVAIAEGLKQQYGFVVPSMQSIWFGRSERIFACEEERQELLAYTKKAIDYADAIDCKNLVFGCPRNRKVEAEWGLSKEQTEEIACSFFKELGDYAAAKGTVISMEPNPPIYNTNYVNTTKQALELIERVNSRGFLLNLDIGTMICNEEAVKVLEGKVPVINHVHVSEPGLKLIEARELHKELAHLLKAEDYHGFVSIEVGKQEVAEALKDVMEYVAEVFHD